MWLHTTQEGAREGKAHCPNVNVLALVSNSPPKAGGMRHQVLILNRGRKRAPNLQSSDRIIAGLCTLMMRPARVLRSAVVLKTSTLLHFHKMLVQQKYRLLFSPNESVGQAPKARRKN